MNNFDKLIDKYCKFAIKVPGNFKTQVITGIVRDIDYDSGYFFIEYDRGFSCFNIEAIVAVKIK